MPIKGSLLERELGKYLPKKGKLAQAMRYSVFAGGKRFRPLLCLAAARALGCAEKKVIPFACAVEMIHTFTLIHDDLPAMDNADYRRGKPACHKKFGEALAILAGDALNTLAFKIMADYPEAARELATALLEVVAGQVEDIGSAGRKLSFKQIKSIHAKKTAALLLACVRGSAAICKAAPAKIKSLASCAQHLGLAFQTIDDILDVTSTSKRLGKPVGADRRKGFPYLIGLEKSKQLARVEADLAFSSLKSFGNEADTLRGIIDFVVRRKK